MVPSGFITSQHTPTGGSPAAGHSATVASVCPARSASRPGRAASGNTCPGRRKSAGRASGLASRRTVAARSAADTPVPVPAARSTGTCGRVPCRSPSPGIGGISSRSSTSGAHGTVLCPQHLGEQEGERVRADRRPGEDHVAFHLAVRVPDHAPPPPAASWAAAFSAPVRPEMCPAQPSDPTARATSALAAAGRADGQPRDQVRFQVHPVPGGQAAQRGPLQRGRDQHHREAVPDQSRPRPG